MSRRQRYSKAFFLVGFLLICSCGHNGVPGGFADLPDTQSPVVNGAPESPGNDSFPVLFHLKTRNRFITVRCGADGPIYTIKDHKGNILSENVPDSVLRAKFPEIHGIFDSGIAKGVLWAGL